uniref:Uncharacterized protein n=1 Tax=Anopheles dirus TaxID=7168 RepID=A0A182NWR2_9DIPT
STLPVLSNLFCPVAYSFGTYHLRSIHFVGPECFGAVKNDSDKVVYVLYRIVSNRILLQIWIKKET